MVQTYEDSAHLVMQRCDLLATLSEEPGRITRRFASAPMHQVHEVVGSWLRAAGLSVEVDAIGNLIGRRAADDISSSYANVHAKTLLLGSHLDTVRDAGKYDGILGVMIALACMERLQEQGAHLPFAIELLGFTEEEGLRYHSAYTGSKVASGTFDPRNLALKDVDGIALADAIRTFGGDPDPAVLASPRWTSADLLGYCEVHIEQGPVLEARDLPLAVVTSIVGQQRLLFRFSGEQGHAGTLPMSLRHDALCAAAEFVLLAESLGRQTPGLVTTIGQLSVEPGASNVVPGAVELSLDLRHADDTLLARCAQQLRDGAEQISAARGLAVSSQLVQLSRTTRCSERLVQLWEQALRDEGYPVFQLPSGAGHDGVSVSALTDISMLFVRCRGGVSHHPSEAVLERDVASALAVCERFLLNMVKEVPHEPV